MSSVVLTVEILAVPALAGILVIAAATAAAMEEVAADAAVAVVEEAIDLKPAYILSGTFIPNKPIAEEITFAVISAIFNRNCFFSPDSAFITECSV